MINRRMIVWGAASLAAGLVSLIVFITAVYSADDSPASEVLIDNATKGYYNSSIGNKLDGVLPWFPSAPASPDPTLKPAPEPDPEELVFRAGLAALLEEDPLPLGSGWGGGEQSIPRSWARTTETAIIYEIDAGPKGIKKLTGSFGVDNGIYVWVDGRYKFGAMEPGGAPLTEYPDIPLDDLGPGKHYLQILREDHGAATGYAIEIKGTEVISDTVVLGQVESDTVSYDGRPQPAGQEFFPETCTPERASLSEPCSPTLVMTPSDDINDLPAEVRFSCQDDIGKILIYVLIRAHRDLAPDEAIVWFIEYGRRFAGSLAEACLDLANAPTGRVMAEASNTTSIGIAQGAILVRLIERDHVWKSVSPVAEFALTQPGTMITAFDPQSGTGLVIAFSGSVTVSPSNGSTFEIGPAQQVTLTAESVGPITDLPQIYLPAVTR